MLPFEFGEKGNVSHMTLIPVMIHFEGTSYLNCSSHLALSFILAAVITAVTAMMGEKPALCFSVNMRPFQKKTKKTTKDKSNLT